MSPENLAQFRLNEQTIARFAGLAPMSVKPVTCKICDQEDCHRCTNCDQEIGELSCEKRHGLCVDCFDEEQWAVKN